MFLHYDTNLAIVLTILIAYTTRAQNLTNCQRQCGEKSQQYPFGFSEGCEVQLNCINNDQVQVGDFLVQNVTTSSMFINLPEKCNRSMQSIVSLFGDNFAPTYVEQQLPRSKLHGVEDEDKNGDSMADKLENWGFYFVVIVGFATGFWGVIGTLSFKKSWSNAYFIWVEDVADKIYVAVVIKVRKLKMQQI